MQSRTNGHLAKSFLMQQLVTFLGPFVEQMSRSSLNISVSGRPAAVGMFSLGLICVISVASSRGRLNVQR